MESGHQEGRQRAHCLWSVFSTPALLNTCAAAPFQGGQALPHFTGQPRPSVLCWRLQKQQVAQLGRKSRCPSLSSQNSVRDTQDHLWALPPPRGTAAAGMGILRGHPDSKMQRVSGQEHEAEFKAGCCTYRLCDFGQVS